MRLLLLLLLLLVPVTQAHALGDWWQLVPQGTDDPASGICFLQMPFSAARQLTRLLRALVAQGDSTPGYSPDLIPTNGPWKGCLKVAMVRSPWARMRLAWREAAQTANQLGGDVLTQFVAQCSWADWRTRGIARARACYAALNMTVADLRPQVEILRDALWNVDEILNVSDWRGGLKRVLQDRGGFRGILNRLPGNSTWNFKTFFGANGAGLWSEYLEDAQQLGQTYDEEDDDGMD